MMGFHTAGTVIVMLLILTIAIATDFKNWLHERRPSVLTMPTESPTHQRRDKFDGKPFQAM
jgi:hypothetical protein